MFVERAFTKAIRFNFLGKRFIVRELVPNVILVVLFLIIVAPLIFKTDTGVSGSHDEIRYHYETILNFARQFPVLDLQHYRSASTPLYHITLMLMTPVLGTSLIPLRLANAALSMMCLLVAYWYLSIRSKHPLKALIFASVLLMSPYFVRSAIMLFTDNMAFLLALLSIMVLDDSVMRRPRVLVGNIFILLTIFTRQIYAWLIGLPLWLFVRGAGSGSWRLNLKKSALVLIPLAGLAFWIVLWGGLSPFGSYSQARFNWDMPVYAVSLVGLYGAFFAPWFVRLYKQNPNRRKRVYIFVAITIAVVYLLVWPVSNEYFFITRGGALWLLTTYLPTALSTSIVFWLLFPLGLVWLSFMIQYLLSRRESLMVVSLLLWFGTNLINQRTYQRYYELFLLFFIGYALITLKAERRLEWVGLALLPIFLLGLTIYQYAAPILFQ